MNISTPQIKELATAVRAGLVPLFRPAPMTPVEWADENFYLSSESSYQEGRWEMRVRPHAGAMRNGS